jgi:hypothetical protein
MHIVGQFSDVDHDVLSYLLPQGGHFWFPRETIFTSLGS